MVSLAMYDKIWKQRNDQKGIFKIQAEFRKM